MDFSGFDNDGSPTLEFYGNKASFNLEALLKVRSYGLISINGSGGLLGHDIPPTRRVPPDPSFPPPSFSALQDQVTKHSLFYSGLPASMPFSRIMDEIYESVDNVEVRINPRTIKRPKHRHLPPQGPYHVMDPLPSLR